MLAGNTTFYQATKGVVQDGLVLNIDAGVRESVRGVGIMNLVGIGSGLMVNGPTINTLKGGSINFDGINDYAICGSGTDLDSITNITACTWALSASGYDVNNNTYTVSRYYNNTAQNGWLSYIGGMDGRESASQYITGTSNYQFASGEWVHTVGVKSGNIWSVYVNGILRSSITSGNGSTVFGNNNIYLAGLPQFAVYSNIKISQVLVYNRALSSGEVYQNFQATRYRFGV